MSGEKGAEGDGDERVGKLNGDVTDVGDEAARRGVYESVNRYKTSETSVNRNVPHQERVLHQSARARERRKDDRQLSASFSFLPTTPKRKITYPPLMKILLTS